MADPLSMAASIAGLIGLASQLSKACYACYSFQQSIKHAPDSFQLLVGELELLRKVLFDLEQVYLKKTHELPSVTHVMKELTECQKDVEEFGIKLSPNFQKIANRLRWPHKEREMKHFISRLQSYRSMFNSAKTNDGILLTMQNLTIANDTQQLLQSEHSNKELQRLLNWLSPLEFRSRQNELYHNRRQIGTGTWIIRDQDFMRWRDSGGNPMLTSLVFKGDPGAGKTILCSMIIQHLLKRPTKAPLAYIYCNHQDRGAQTPRHLLGSVAKQLIAIKDLPRSEALNDLLDSFYKIWEDKLPPKQALIRLVIQICQSLKRSFVVIDGLDELDIISLKAITALLKELRAHRVHFLVTGRPYIFRSAELAQIRATEVEIKAKEEDITAFVKARIELNDNLQMLIDGDRYWQSQLIKQITLKAEGQFAFAYMYMRSIAEETCKADLLTELNRPCSTLPDEYEKTMARIKASIPRCKLAMRVLSWLISAKSSLRASELCEALAIDITDVKLRKDRQTSLSTILDVCHGLTIFNEISGTVELFHFTAAEFLRSLPDLISHISLDVPRSCLVYLRYADFDKPCKNRRECQERRAQYPFVNYASCYWADHLRGEPEKKLESALLTFLTGNKIYSALQILPPVAAADPRLLGKDSDYENYRPTDGSAALYLAVCFQLRATVQALISRGHRLDIQVPWGDHYSPLHAAILLEDVDICHDLVQAGAPLNLQDRWGLSPLHLILHQESDIQTNLVEMLCSTDADCTILDQDCDTPLHIAAAHSEINSLQLLLRYVSNVNAQNKTGSTALHAAVKRCRPDIVDVLLEQYADPTIADTRNNTPLSLAIEVGYYSIVQKLLATAKSDGSTHRYSEKDLRAAEGFLAPLRKNEAELLARESANFQSHLFDRGKTAHRREYLLSMLQGQKLSSLRRRERRDVLFWAAVRGDGGTMQDLLIGLEDVNEIRETERGRTPLHKAAEHGRERVVWHLLAAGADPGIKDHGGKTARDLATSPEVLSLLENDKWLRLSRTIITRNGKGVISGSRLRDFYGRKRAESSKETIDPEWGGLLANTEIQPEDFDSFTPLPFKSLLNFDDL